MKNIVQPPWHILFEEEEGAPDPPYRLPTPPPPVSTKTTPKAGK